jgi:S-DNA-T family DNA segregation ATPase FtsK/SpoIIIE
LGNGDLLFLWPGTSTLLRGQGTYVSDDEITKVVDFVGTTEPDFVKELVQLKASGPGEGDANRFKNRDELYEAAIDIVVREGRGSVSLLQRSLGIGYGRGARLIDFMAEDGIVGAYNGSQAREVLITLEQWQEMSGQNAAAAEPTKTMRSNRVTPLPDEKEEVEGPPFDADDDDETQYDEGDVVDVEDQSDDEYDDEEADDDDVDDGEA